MAEARRGPGLPMLVGLVLLAGTIGVGLWWSNRPKPEAVNPLNPDEMDVVCTGRVDAAGMVIPLEPVVAGRVAKLGAGITEGGPVRKGQEILRIEDDSARFRLLQAEAVVNAAQVDVDAAISEAERFPAQIAARGLLLDAAGAKLESARKMLEQRRDQQTFVPLGRPELEALEAQIREMSLMEAAERATIADLKKLDPDLRVRLARAKLSAAQADRSFAQKAVQECILQAPSNGTILRLQVTIGGVIAPGTPLPPVIFAPAGPLVIRAEIDQEFLGRVKAGMRAIAQDENHPEGRTWAGRVRSVAGWVAMRRTIVLDPGELNDVRTVECVIDLDPPVNDLWIGQRMRVRLQRDAK